MIMMMGMEMEIMGMILAITPRLLRYFDQDGEDYDGGACCNDGENLCPHHQLTSSMISKMHAK